VPDQDREYGNRSLRLDPRRAPLACLDDRLRAQRRTTTGIVNPLGELGLYVALTIACMVALERALLGEMLGYLRRGMRPAAAPG
jgi:hypothetical protein